MGKKYGISILWSAKYHEKKEILSFELFLTFIIPLVIMGWDFMWKNYKPSQSPL